MKHSTQLVNGKKGRVVTRNCMSQKDTSISEQSTIERESEGWKNLKTNHNGGHDRGSLSEKRWSTKTY